MKFKATVEKFKNKPALNDMTYKQLLDLVENYSLSYESHGTGSEIIIEILAAAAADKPLVILPMDKTDYVPVESYPEDFGIYLYTSGSTESQRHAVFLNEKFLLANCATAIELQELTDDDIVLNVCSMHHTGGINIQVLPALLIGATVYIENFDPRNFYQRLHDTRATVTHLTPRMLDVLSRIRNDKTSRLRLVAAGSDCVKRSHAEYWLDRKIDFIINYGLTEAGPWIINHRFTDKEQLTIFDRGIPLGSRVWCEYQINQHQLYLRGDNVASQDWLPTGDCVEKIDDFYFYNGRISAGCKVVEKRY